MGKVNLSKFICRELVYDYLAGKLDAARRTEFQKYLSEDTELRRMVDQQKHALRYIGELKKTELGAEYFTHLCHLHKLDFIEKESEFPQPVVKPVDEELIQGEPGLSFWEKYPNAGFIFRRTAEALSLAVVVFLIVKVLPESFFQPGTEITSPPTISLVSENPLSQPKVLMPENESDLLDQVKVKTGTTGLQSVRASKNVVNEPDISGNTSKSENTDSNIKQTVPVKYYLYRSVAYVDDMNAVSKEFLDFLNANGATKAGKVKLGWEKPQARYFHFHIGQKQEELIKNFLSSKTKFKLNKISHWRKTPKDKIRVIVEIRQQQQ